MKPRQLSVCGIVYPVGPLRTHRTPARKAKMVRITIELEPGELQAATSLIEALRWARYCDPRPNTAWH